MSIDGFINSTNQFVQTMGAVQGAADAMMPAMYAVSNTVNQVAGVFTGDTYQPAPYMPPPPPPPSPRSGLIGSLLSGGAAAGLTHSQTADAFRQIKAGETGAGFKSLGLSSLKSAGVGALVSGVVSGIQNFSDSSKGLISGAQARGNVVADTVGGLLAGTTAGLTGGLAGLALSSMGVAGIGLTIGAVVAGAAGAAGANLLYTNSGARDSLARSAGGTSNMYPPGGYGYGAPPSYGTPGYGYGSPPNNGYGYGQPPNYGYSGY